MTPSLSILICSVRERARKMLWLFDRLVNSCTEVLVLLDNRRRTVGAKRQALLEMAQGEYIAFVDDDDSVENDYILRIQHSMIMNNEPDLIVFPIGVTIDGGQEGIVEPSIKYIPKPGQPIAEYKPPVTCRPPHELCVWRRELAIQARFPDTSYGEDFAWAAQLWPLVKTEARIDKVLYHWRHNTAEEIHKDE